MGAPRLRSQQKLVLDVTENTTINFYGSISGFAGARFTWIEGGSVSDSTHRWPPPSGEGLSDTGGNFSLTKYQCDPGAIFVDFTTGVPDYTRRYRGVQFASQSSADFRNALHLELNWMPGSAPSVTQMLIDGATAISRCAPANPHASVAQTLGELRRDGVPAIPLLKSFEQGLRPMVKAKPSIGSRYLKRKVKPKPMLKSAKAGGEYLNVEFGWKPLLNDVRKIANAAKSADSVLQQYHADSGRVIRRRYEFPVVTETSSEDFGLVAPSPDLGVGSYSVPKGHLTRTRTVTQRKWFSGAFTYYAPPAEGLQGMKRLAQDANHLLGVGITPGSLWDLTPWSWAVDWFANTGDVLNNVSMAATDGQVMVYGYMMAETTTVVTVSNLGARLLVGDVPLDLTTTFTTIEKRRVRATPFGFGLDVAAFSPRQMAIVAALGLSQNGRRVAL